MKQTARPAPGSVLALLAVLFVVAPHSNAQDYIEGTSWQTHEASYTPRTEGVGIFYQGKLYALAGFARDVIATNVSEVYDPKTDTWTLLKPIPRRVSHVGAAVVDGQIWIVGGFEGDHPGPAVKIVQIYNIASDSWSTGPSLPAPRASGTLALSGRHLHYVGGLLPDRQTDTGEHLVLDVDRRSLGWKAAAPLPKPRNHLSSVVLDGSLYAIGGQYGHDDSYTLSKIVHRYDKTSNSWSRRADMPLGRSHAEAATFVYDGKIIMAGGIRSGEAKNASLDLITAYDPSTNSWKDIGRLPEKLLGLAAGVIGNRIYAANGSIGLTGNAQESTWSTPLETANAFGCETGTASVSQSGRNQWHKITLSTEFDVPVVLMSPVSYRGPQPATVRVRGVTSSGFEFKIDEWHYLDGSHTRETVHYVVFEAGRHAPGYGHEVEAAVTWSTSEQRSVKFDRDFSTAPIVFSQIVSSQDSRPAVTRQRNVSTSGFDLLLQSEEVESGHGQEQVAYVAITPGQGTVGGCRFDAGSTGRAVKDVFYPIAFDQSFSSPPAVLLAMQSVHGPDPSALRYTNLSGSGVEVLVQEEQSKDAETAHTMEHVGFLAMAELAGSDATLAVEESDSAVAGEAENHDLHISRSGTSAANALTVAGNYPNPFNPQTTIHYTLSEEAHVRLEVYDLLGRRVEVLIDGHQEEGGYSATFDASGLAGGVYVYRFEAVGRHFSAPMILLP